MHFRYCGIIFWIAGHLNFRIIQSFLPWHLFLTKFNHTNVNPLNSLHICRLPTKETMTMVPLLHGRISFTGWEIRFPEVIGVVFDCIYSPVFSSKSLLQLRSGQQCTFSFVRFLRSLVSACHSYCHCGLALCHQKW